jgi:predicted TIM-barrel fold metal-dependent hydrolase
MSKILTNSYVDCHFHIFAAEKAIENARYRPQYSALLDQWTEYAKPLKVDRGVLVQTSFMGFDNSLVLQALRQNPDNFRGVVALSEHTTLAQMRQLHAHGVRGIRLNYVGTNHRLESIIEQTQFIDALFELGWHIELHTEKGQLASVIAQLPSQIALVIDHMGKPASTQLDDATFVHVAKRNVHAPVYIKLSGAYRLNGLDPIILTQRWVNAVGPSRLLWGSDWPCTNHEDQADYATLFNVLRQWLINEDFIHNALVDNPNYLYWREAAVNQQRPD